MRSKILIHRVRVVIIVKVVPAEKHLPDWPAVHENQCREFAGRIRGLEKLSVNLSTVGGFESHLLGKDKVRGWKVARQSLGRQRFHVRSIGRGRERQKRIARGRVKKGNLTAAVKQRRIHFDALAVGDLLGRAPADAHTPQVPAIYVVLVRRENDERL